MLSVCRECTQAVLLLSMLGKALQVSLRAQDAAERICRVQGSATEADLDMNSRRPCLLIAPTRLQGVLPAS